MRRLVLDSSRFHSKWGNRIFDLSYRLITDVRPTRWFAARLTQWLAARPIRRAVLERAPDIVISTYPGTTEVLGDLRAKGRIEPRSSPRSPTWPRSASGPTRVSTSI